MTTEMQIVERPPVPRPFNPNEHIIPIKSNNKTNDYLPVQWRLVWFRTLCPDGTIDTEEIVVDLDRECESEVSVWNADTKRSEKQLKRAAGYARFRAVVTDGKGGRATGTKTERAVDFPDFVEKAETGAIGRALAALGYGTQFALEFAEGERIVDAPVEQRPAKPYQERRAFVEADKTTDQALHALAQPGSYEQHHGNGSQPEDDDSPTFSLGSLKLFCKNVYGNDAEAWKKVVSYVTKPEKSGRGDVPDEALNLADRKGIHATLIAKQKANAAKAS